MNVYLYLIYLQIVYIVDIKKDFVIKRKNTSKTHRGLTKTEMSIINESIKQVTSTRKMYAETFTFENVQMWNISNK